VRRVPRVLVAFVLLLSTRPAHAEVRPGAVAAEHRLAAEAGAEMLRGGGSAVDAAIAAAAAGCVVHPSSCGIGGGGFALIRLASGETFALDFRERAPGSTSADRFFDHGQPRPERLRRGGLAVAVPGEVAGWEALHAGFGRLPLADVLAPAIRLARDGFALDDAPHLRQQVEKQRELLVADPGLRTIFLTKDGQPPGPGFRVVQGDLARTLEGIAAHGAAAFYGGPVATALVAAVRARGGVLDAVDLAAYRPQWRQPLAGSSRGRTLITFPPPGSGGVVLETLGILEHENPGAADAESAAWLRVLAGAMAQGFTDRARFYGDPDFTPVPVAHLLARPRLARIAAALRAGGCSPVDTAPAADGGTANVSVVDAEGDAVVLTTTINLPFGAGFLAPRTGIILNDEMDDFALAAGVPNAYGLVGAAPNTVAPWKRPQSSMSPTIVLDGARPELVAGGSGGPFIISGVLQVLLDVVAFGRDIEAAVAAPRIHDQGVPPVLLVEPAVPEAARQGLARWCHPVRVMPGLGAVSAAGIGRDGTLHAAGDPRKDGGAVVVH
jgi:gamma-glutamyltranspeptidase / glutathione hydrolase